MWMIAHLTLLCVYGTISIVVSVLGITALTSFDGDNIKLDPDPNRMVSVPLCWTKDQGVFVAASVSGSGASAVSELKFQVSVRDWCEARMLDNVLLVHNLDKFEFIMTIDSVSDGTKKLERRFIRDSGARGETLTMGEITWDELMTWMGIIGGKLSYRPRWNVTYPAYRTLDTNATEPSCSLKPFETAIVALFEKIDVHMNYKSNGLLDVSFRKFWATVAHDATPELYPVLAPSPLPLLSLLLPAFGLFWAFSAMAIGHPIEQSKNQLDRGKWSPVISQE